MSSVKNLLDALASGLEHVFRRRMTLRYPEQKLELPGEGYQYDPKQQVGVAGFKGRHILYLDKCTGCQLCSIMCENISQAIEMVPVEGEWPKNKKGIFPQIDYGRCVFCGFCVDACPFYALFETDDYELCGYERRSLLFTPRQLAVPPKKHEGTSRLLMDRRGAYHA